MRKRLRHRSTLPQIIGLKSILKYTLPSVIMMIFTALYGMADGLLSSRYIGTEALSSINIVYPYICLLVALGVMIGTGGSAIISEKLGEGKDESARSSFTQIIVFTILIGLILSLLSYFFAGNITRLLGANDALHHYSLRYLKILSLFSVACLLQQVFQMIFITAGKARTGLIITIFGGLTNIILGFFFIHYLHLGIAGAGLASGIARSLIAIYGIVYFYEKNTALYFTKFKLRIKELINAFENGSSEMITDISISVTTFLFNIIMLKYLGENGVAAATIILYIQLFIYSIYIGFSNGIAPIESYYFGEHNYKGLRKLVIQNFKIIIIASIILTILTYLFGKYFILSLSQGNSEVYNIAMKGSIRFFTCFLFAGMNIYTSSFFTSVENGKASALVSFIRSLLFTTVCIGFFPMLFGINSIWIAVPIAEILSIGISYFCLKKYWKVYKLQKIQ